MDAVDQVARDNAMRAIAMVEAHERVCEERAKASASWQHDTSDKLDDLAEGLSIEIQKISKSMEGISDRIWLAASSIIVLLLGCVGYLIHNHGL